MSSKLPHQPSESPSLPGIDIGLYRYFMMLIFVLGIGGCLPKRNIAQSMMDTAKQMGGKHLIDTECGTTPEKAMEELRHLFKDRGVKNINPAYVDTKASVDGDVHCARLNGAKAMQAITNKLKGKGIFVDTACVAGEGKPAKEKAKKEAHNFDDFKGNPRVKFNTLSDSGFTCAKIEKLAPYRQLVAEMLKKLGASNEGKQPDGSKVFCAQDKGKIRAINMATTKIDQQFIGQDINYSYAEKDDAACVKGTLRNPPVANQRPVRPSPKPSSTDSSGRRLGPRGGALPLKINLGNSLNGDNAPILPGASRRNGIHIRVPKDEIKINSTQAVSANEADVIGFARQIFPSVKGCYQRELKKDSSLRGKLVMLVTVGRNHTATVSFTDATTLNNATVQSCIIKAAQRIIKKEKKFKPGNRFEIPFNFSASY